LRRYIDKGTKSEDAPAFQAQYVLGQVLEKQGNIQGAKAAYLAAKNQAGDFGPASAALKKLGA
jgi:TolA-binding protein